MPGQSTERSTNCSDLRMDASNLYTYCDLADIRAVADTMKCTGGNLDPGKWRENQVSEFAFCVFLNHIIERVNNLCGMRGYITL